MKYKVNRFYCVKPRKEAKNFTKSCFQIQYILNVFFSPFKCAINIPCKNQKGIGEGKGIYSVVSSILNLAIIPYNLSFKTM